MKVRVTSHDIYVASRVREQVFYYTRYYLGVAHRADLSRQAYTTSGVLRVWCHPSHRNPPPPLSYREWTRTSQRCCCRRPWTTMTRAGHPVSCTPDQKKVHEHFSCTVQPRRTIPQTPERARAFPLGSDVLCTKQYIVLKPPCESEAPN